MGDGLAKHSLTLFAGPEKSLDEVGLSMQANFMKRKEMLDLYFMEARAKLIDLAAFMDRMERAPGEDDFRMKGFLKALEELGPGRRDRAKAVLLSLSDPTTEPIAAATTKAASGAWPGGA